MTDFASLKIEATAYGMRLRECTKWHWQLLTADGKPLVNYWPTKGKFGKAIEQHNRTVDISMKSKTGTVRELMDFASEILLAGMEPK